MHQNWSQVSEVGPQSWSLHMGPFYSLLVAIYKHAKLRALHHNLQAKCRSSTCLITSLEHNFPAYKGGKCSCDNVKQCVLTIQQYSGTVMQKEQPVGGSANVLWLLLSAVQLYSTLSSCNFQPSPLHWYRFKRLLTITHAEAVEAINSLLWFWCFTFYESKEGCFQNTHVAQLN